MASRYVLLAITSIVGAAVSGLCSMFNPITLILMYSTGWAVSLLGRQPPLGGFSAMGSALFISVAWPLLILPLHWLNYRVLGWNVFRFLSLFFVTGAILAFGVLLLNSSPVG